MSSTAENTAEPFVEDLKHELVDGYHMLGHAGLGLGLLAHLTARAPGGDTFWTYQLGKSVEEVTYDDLREVDFELNLQSADGVVNPTLRIHGMVYAARPDIMCIAHHHGDNCVAMGAIGANLQTFDRNAARFHNDIDIIEDYDNAHEIAEQGDAIVAKLDGKRALILQYHGVLIGGRSIRDTVISTIELERSMGVQLKAMAAGTVQTMREGEIDNARDFLTSDLFIDGTWDYRKRVMARDNAG
ncbi:MAG: class II aldolase/adducin family protein [Alphaproteobacteria bacterium]